MTVTLKDLRKLGVIPRTTNRWTKSALQVRAEYIDKFGDRKVPEHLSFVSVSERAKKMLRDVNIDMVGNKMVFPAAHHKVVIRETKYGMIIKATNKGGTKYEIILAEDLNHIKYARKLGKVTSKEGIDSVWGTLKSAEFRLADGRIKQGYMRDMVGMADTINGAAENNRYKIDSIPGVANADVMAMIRFTL